MLRFNVAKNGSVVQKLHYPLQLIQELDQLDEER